jgi:hypothetical protein
VARLQEKTGSRLVCSCLSRGPVAVVAIAAQKLGLVGIW